MISPVKNTLINILKCANKFHTSVPTAGVIDIQKTTNAIRVPDPVRLMRAGVDDVPRVIYHLRRSYMQEEPTMRALGVAGTNAVMEELAKKQLSEGYSLMAVPLSNCNQLLGVIINGTTCPWDADRADLFAECVKCPGTRKLMHFYAHVKRSPALHERYSTLKIFEMDMLSVDANSRRAGIAEKLCRQSLYLARDLGYKIARMDCTNDYSSRMAEKVGMTLAWEMPYSSYLDCNHEPMIKTEPPHTHVRVFIEQLKKVGRTDKELSKLYNLNLDLNSRKP